MFYKSYEIRKNTKLRKYPRGGLDDFSYFRRNSYFVAKLGNSKGITLVEMVVYVALLGMISVFVVNFLIQIVNTYERARAEREVLSNARLLMERISETIVESREVYAPASRFNDNQGQLSLVSSATTTPEHASIFVDFWVDNGRFWTRREGAGSEALSAATVRVTRFRLERIFQALGLEAVRVTLQVDFANAKFPTQATLNSTAALRGNY